MFKIVDVSKSEAYVGLEPVALAEAKAWILVDYADDDSLITSLITQSRQSIEDFCHISIVAKTILLTAMPDNWLWNNSNYLVNVSRWDRSFYGFPTMGDWSELPYGPVATVQSVVSVNLGITTILTLNTDYYLRGTNFQQIKVNTETETLLIQYTTPVYCPEVLKEAILNEIAFRYELRGSGLNRYASQNVGASEGAQALAKQYQRIWV